MKDWKVGECDCCGLDLTRLNSGFSFGAQWLCKTCFDQKSEKQQEK